MPLKMIVGAMIALVALGAGGAAAGSSPEVTITGSLLCNRACVPERWNHDPTSGDHTLALFALAGTPEIEAELNAIMEECWPGETLDCDQAVTLLAEFDKRLKYYLTPSERSDRNSRSALYSWSLHPR